MILTDKSIRKNIKAVLDEVEDITAYLFGKDEKRGLLVLTTANRFVILTAPVFGKPKIRYSFTADDVKLIDIVSEIKMGGPYLYLPIETKDKKFVFTAIFHSVNNDATANKMLRFVYEQNPSAKPDYLKDDELIDYLTLSNGNLKFSRKSLFFQKLNKNTVDTLEQYSVSDITDFDILPQKIGSKNILYLEINGNLKIEKFEKTTEENSVFTIIAGGTKAVYGLGDFAKMIRKTDAKLQNPSYMEADEDTYFTERYKSSAVAVGDLSNKYLRLTDRNIYLLKGSNKHKPEMQEKIPLREIISFKKLSQKMRDRWEYGLSILTEQKKYEFWGFSQNVADEMVELIGKKK